jgi:hypothetical protein
LKALVTGGVKRGVPFNGEMKEGRRGDFFPSAEVAGGDHGAVRGRSAAVATCSMSVWEEEESWLGQVGRLGQKLGGKSFLN